MTTATITWTPPAASVSQAEVESVSPELSADAGANWSPLPAVPVSAPQEVVISDIAPGDWKVRLTVNDAMGQSSNGVETDFSIPFEAPSEVINVDITLS